MIDSLIKVTYDEYEGVLSWLIKVGQDIEHDLNLYPCKFLTTEKYGFWPFKSSQVIADLDKASKELKSGLVRACYNCFFYRLSFEATEEGTLIYNLYKALKTKETLYLSIDLYNTLQDIINGKFYYENRTK